MLDIHDPSMVRFVHQHNADAHGCEVLGGVLHALRAKPKGGAHKALHPSGFFLLLKVIVLFSKAFFYRKIPYYSFFFKRTFFIGKYL